MSVPKEDSTKKSKEDNHDELLEKYDNFLKMLDYRNTLYYGALFRQMFSDFSTEEDTGSIEKSIDELAKLLEKACKKVDFDMYNANMKQLHKLFSALIQKLNGSTKLRAYDLDKIDPLVYRMYDDEEILDLLLYFQSKNVKGSKIIAINNNDEVVFSNKKKYKLQPSKKLNDLIDLFGKLNNPT